MLDRDMFPFSSETHIWREIIISQLTAIIFLFLFHKAFKVSFSSFPSKWEILSTKEKERSTFEKNIRWNLSKADIIGTIN